MYKELGRKITSLTLLSILLASGVTFAVPGVIPAAEAAHNANLFVSAENPTFANTFAGPMVVEIVITDPDRASLDDAVGEPDVTVNGNKVRMVQATDGSWYAYIADLTQAQRADGTQPGEAITSAGKGLNFGEFCEAGTQTTTGAGIAIGASASFFSGAVAVAMARDVTGTGETNGEDAITGADCTAGIAATNPPLNHVVRENATINLGGTLPDGQIGITDTDSWPFIQLYNFNPTGTADIKYNKAAGTQTTTLTFDTVDGFSGITLDRSSYPPGGEVHATLKDIQLNVDPTDEDSWTFATSPTDSRIYYQLFTEDGLTDADGDADEAVNIAASISRLMFEDNGLVKLNGAVSGPTILTLDDNADQILLTATSLSAATTATLTAGTQPVTFLETEDKNGILSNTDREDNDANIEVTATAPRGQSASIEYNKVATSIIVANSFGTLNVDLPDDEWNSGEEIGVILNDQDANKNTRADEDLNLFANTTSLIPALRIGTPFTLRDTSTSGSADSNAQFYSNLIITNTDKTTPTATTGDTSGLDNLIGPVTQFGANSDVYVAKIDRFSDRQLVTNMLEGSTTDDITGANRGGLVIDLGRDVEDLQAAIKDPRGSTALTRFKGLNMFNYDIRSVTFDTPDGIDTFGLTESVEIYLLVNRSTTTETGGTSFNSDALDVDAIDLGDIALISLGNSTKLSGMINLNRTTDCAPGCVTAGTVAPTITLGAESPAVNPILANLFSSDNDATDDIGLLFVFNPTASAAIDFAADTNPIVADFFTFGITGDGLKTTDRTNSAVYRFELEENAVNSGIFGGMNVPPSTDIFGSAEFQMLNQLTIFDDGLYEGLRTIDERVTFVVHEDLTDEDAPRVNYHDLGGDGVSTQVADQEEASSHSGVVSFDKDNYKVADTVTVTLTDADLNTDSERREVFGTVDPAATIGTFTPTASSTDTTRDAVGEGGLGAYSNGDAVGRLLDITLDDERWIDGDTNLGGTSAGDCAGIDTDGFTTTRLDAIDDGLADTGFSLIETGANTGIFTGDFQIPSDYCSRNAGGTTGGTTKSTTGTDIEVNYVDFRDGSGELIEVGDGAGVRANTGSVSLDRTVYPVPFGQRIDFTAISSGEAPGGRALFPLHTTAIDGTLDEDTETLGDGPLTIHVRVNDPDFDVSATGEDTIAFDSGSTDHLGPVKITVSRGASSVILGYAGGDQVNAGKIDQASGETSVDSDLETGTTAASAIRQFGPMTEIAPNAGIFEADIVVRYTDGPQSTASCPSTASYIGLNGTARGSAAVRFQGLTATSTTANNYCILQGDIITVEYTDPTDSSGDPNTVTDSATFDLRNGVLQSDKSVYIIGADMIMTLIEPDLDLDSDSAESYDLDLIEWDSDAAEVSMGNNCLVGTTACGASFDPEPSEFRETGDSTGIFQIVIEIPNALGGNNLDRGEEIQLEYTDWGPSGADHIGDEDEDIKLTVYTSNFGATVELDQKVYTWTDKVFITIVAPDHNFDSNLVDEIGDTADDKIVVATRGDKLEEYKLVETGTDTGIFTGEVILTGFAHDADGNLATGAATTGSDTDPRTTPAIDGGPTNGFLKSDDDDGLTVSFEFTEDETVVGSALIRWNIGEVQFLEASYPATGQGVLRVVDPDMNINPEAVDNFEVDVWSDSDAGGIDLTVTETNEATGIFEGIISFSITDESSGHRLRVSEGDTVTGEYEDNTLPSPYTTADELEVTATTFIGTIVPPLERAPASNPRIVDAFGNELDEVNVDQQVQVTADLANGQDRDQPFAYLVQIQDSDGVTVSLSWITGSLAPGQSLNPAQSWTPTAPGTYTVQIFVWESVDNPDALSPPVSTTVTVV